MRACGPYTPSRMMWHMRMWALQAKARGGSWSTAPMRIRVSYTGCDVCVSHNRPRCANGSRSTARKTDAGVKSACRRGFDLGLCLNPCQTCNRRRARPVPYTSKLCPSTSWCEARLLPRSWPAFLTALPAQRRLRCLAPAGVPRCALLVKGIGFRTGCLAEPQNFGRKYTTWSTALGMRYSIYRKD